MLSIIGDHRRNQGGEAHSPTERNQQRALEALNQESNHLHQVIRKALNADESRKITTTIHNGPNRWTQWKAARPTLMATANDPNYNEGAGKPTNADIVSTLQMYETGAPKVLAGVRIRHAVLGEEIFLSYHSGRAKTISLLNP